MTFLGYSGRGGGRGRGQGRGRGRGRGWGRGGGMGRSVPHHSYGRGRGRFSYQQHQQSYYANSGNGENSSNKWVRNDDEASNSESSGSLREEKRMQEQSFVKRGKNQLILKTDVIKKPLGLESAKNEESSSVNQSSLPEKCEEFVGKAESKHIDSQLSTTSTGAIKMDKLAESDLKMKSSGNETDMSNAGKNIPLNHLEKVTSHKLVTSSASSTQAVPSRKTSHQGPPHWNRNTNKRPPPRSGRSRPGAAKRIAIEVTHKTSGEEEESMTNQDPTANGESSSEPTEKLTDFAYRQTSKRVQRGNESKSLKWSANGDSAANSSLQQSGRPMRRNMGLVRVQPNMDKTPICKTFLRGINCPDKYCKKRHDIPKEFSVPVCSFFQRHGNCLKGDDCPFRHIKVNPRAMVCPSFAVLGFCDDADCSMKHERAKPKNKRK